MKHVEINKMKKGGFGSNVWNAGLNLGKAYVDYNLSGLGLTEVIPDSAYKGNTGAAFGKATNIAGQVGKAVLPAAANVLLPGSGAAVTGLQQGLSGFNKPLGRYSEKTQPTVPAAENQPVDQPTYMNDASLGTTYRAYGKGGDVDGDGEKLVNVEGGELEVTPDTFEVVQDFKELPKHPKGKDIVNLKGNVYVSGKNIIIPAKMREKFLSSKREQRALLVKEIIKNTEPKKGVGDNPESTPISSITNVYNGQAPQEGGSGANYSGVAGAAAAVPGLIYGIGQTQRSKKALEELNKTPLPKYTVTPEQLGAQQRANQSYQRAQGLALGGYTPAEKAAYQQNLAKANNTALYNARNVGGGQSSAAINGALGSQNLNALLNFASSDAALNRQNIRYADQAGQYLDQTGQQITNQKNLQTNIDIQRRQMQEQALGKALGEGRTNTANSAGQLAGNAALIASQFL